MRKRWLRGAIISRSVYVLMDRRRPIAYGVLNRNFFQRWFIEMLYVVPESRRQGRGVELLGYLEAQTRGASEVWTSANRSNRPMRRLLTKRGFVLSGRVSGLDEGDPELIFVKRGPNQPADRMPVHSPRKIGRQQARHRSPLTLGRENDSTENNGGEYPGMSQNRRIRCGVRCLDQDVVFEARKSLARAPILTIPYICKISGQEEEVLLLSKELAGGVADQVANLRDWLDALFAAATLRTQLCECDLATLAQIPETEVLERIDRMEEAGVLTRQRIDAMNYYCVPPGPTREKISAGLEPYLNAPL